jgi:acetyltransferase-like isoleucine patch superfamily enzyme
MTKFFQLRLFRRVLALCAALSPNVIKITFYRRVFGYKIGPNVRIGLSLIDSGHVTIGEGVKIGHFNRITDIPEVSIGAHSSIGHRNTFVGSIEFTAKAARAFRNNNPVLHVGEHCGISSHHHFDVNDALSIGGYTTIAGVGSVFYTHYINVISGQQSCKPVTVGRYCMIGSSTCFVPGSGVADYTVVGMGSVVTKALDKPHQLIGGNPAGFIRDITSEAAYFHRKIGWIGMFASRPH